MINSAEDKQYMDELSELCRENYEIPKKAFETGSVKRGLRNSDGTGVVAGVTKVGLVHGYIVDEGEKVPVEGKLYYRGYDVEELINNYVAENRYGFEEASYILMFGRLPSYSELERYKELVSHNTRLPLNFTEDVIMRAPSANIMNKMQQGVLALYSYDPDPENPSLQNVIRQSIQLTARVPVIAAHAYSVKRHTFDNDSLLLHYPLPGLSTAQNFLRILGKDVSFNEDEAKLLDLCLILHAEHGGGNNSTFTTRVLSSSGTDIYAAIGGAIGSLKGPKHGGANIKVEEMFDNIKFNVKDWDDDEEVSDYLGKILRKEAGADSSGLIYGMGHAIYTASDPRAKLLKKYAKKLAEEKGYSDEFALLEKVESLSPEVFARVTGHEKVICANVDMYSGLVYRMMGIPRELYTPLFATARITGWCAHRLEELLTGGKIVRPAYKTIWQKKPYVSIDQR